MHSCYMQIINVLIVCIFLMLIHVQVRYTSKNSKILKRKILCLSGSISKENVEEIIRIVYITIVIALLLIFLKMTNNIYLINIFPQNILKSIFLILLAIVALIQIMFVITMIVYGVLLKKNCMESMREIDWLAVDIKRFVYTGYARTFFIALFDIYVFFNILFNMFYLKLKLPLCIAIVMTVLIYSLNKAIMRKNFEKYIPMFLLGFSLGLSNITLIIASDSLLIGTIFMYISLVLISFKNIKARI